MLSIKRWLSRKTTAGPSSRATVSDASPAITLFTICFTNYFAQARVLADSVSRCHPGLALTVFVLDAEDEQEPHEFPFRMISAASLFSRQEWNRRRCYYNPLEFATSIKAACFRSLLDGGAEMAIYLDPDIQLFAPLDFLWSQADGEPALTLTPHMLTPLPRDGHLPSDLSILQAGIYNLGFAALRNTSASLRLLDWWDAHLKTACLQDVREGVFTDQKWMDFAPVFVSGAHILRHVGCNVAYWNLHERTPRLKKGQWQVRGPDGVWQALVFFHFSGFVPGEGRLSRHENRFGWSPPGDARKLLEAYGQALIEAGYPTRSGKALTSAHFSSGMTWDPVCQSLYRQAEAEARTASLGDPLQDDAFLAWASDRAAGDHVSRYIRAVLRLRPDVAAAFADGANSEGLDTWLQVHGCRELELDPALLERLKTIHPVLPPAVHVVGYLRAHLGVGEAARNLATALNCADIPLTLCDVTELAGSPVGAYELPAIADDAIQPQIALLNCNADVLPDLLPLLPEAVRKAYRIGCWYWETPDFPEEWCNRFNLVDEIWASTRFVADALREKATVPVALLPPMVAPPPMRADKNWMCALVPALRPDEFVFLFQLDISSVPHRKNPDGVIEAFRCAFAPEEPVRLLIKLLNAERAPDVLKRLQALAEGLRISFLDTPLESDERFRLMASTDCFVSLHRAEGLGLSILEAMAYGLPVVTTAWSGNMDFTTDANAALVAYDLRPTAEAHGPYPAGTIWAEPRRDDAARQMRRVWMDVEWRRSIGQAAAATLAAKCSAEAAGAAMRKRLQRLAASSRLQVQTSTRQS